MIAVELKAVELKKFKKIYIEITNRCNRSCSFCHRSRRPTGFMGRVDFETILTRIRDYTDYLSLHVLGEPLLHPDLGFLLDTCHQQDIKVNLSTNGTLISQHGALLLSKPALRQINFSLHSFERPETGLPLASYLAPIFEFIGRAAAETSMIACLRMWNLDGAASGAEVSQDLEILKRIQSFFGLQFEISGGMTPGNGITLAPGVFLSRDHRFTWPHSPGPELCSRGSCRGLRDHIAILVDGTVVPCCLDAEADIPLGNIHQQPLAEILSSPAANSLRQGFSSQKLVNSLCRRCTYRQRFLPLNHTPRENFISCFIKKQNGRSGRGSLCL
jgi:radical SAM protein with 4Fe4S-binding SPASM domain